MTRINATEKFLKDHGIEEWGDYNHPPRPFQECSMNEFWAKVSGYGFGEWESRQVWLEKGAHYTSPTTDVYLMAYHDKIFMINIEYSPKRKGFDSWQPRCWRVGCIHDWYDVGDRRGNHVRTCKKCGYMYYYDSSG